MSCRCQQIICCPVTGKQVSFREETQFSQQNILLLLRKLESIVQKIGQILHLITYLEYFYGYGQSIISSIYQIDMYLYRISHTNMEGLIAFSKKNGCKIFSNDKEFLNEKKIFCWLFRIQINKSIIKQCKSSKNI